jgi:hypothetical protein
MSPLLLYRDDGPLARAIGRVLGRVVPGWPVLLLLLGMAPGVVAIVVEGDGASKGLAAACAAWLILLGAISSGRPHTDRLRWAVPSTLRAAEYGAVLWLASIAGDSSLPAAFALLGVVAFRHYDLVYRLRYRGATPPAWVSLVALGWEGRLVLVWVLLVVGALPAGLYVVAGLLAVVLVGESILSWTSSMRVDAATHVYEDEEDEAA